MDKYIFSFCHFVIFRKKTKIIKYNINVHTDAFHWLLGQISRFANCRQKTNRQHHKFVNYRMFSNKLFRHAQTQHCNKYIDLENILLCKTNLDSYNNVKKQEENEKDNESESNSYDHKITETGTTFDSESLECVWFFEIGNGSPVDSCKLLSPIDRENTTHQNPEKRKADDEPLKEFKKAKLETKDLKSKRPGFTDDRYHETSYYFEGGLRKVYPYYFTFTTFTKGRWVGEKILDVFAREFRAHPAEEYERCIKSGTLTVNYEKVPVDYRLKHNDLLANVVHRHEIPVASQPITIVHMDDDIVVVNKPASIPVHPCGRYRHNTVVFILAKEYNLKNLRTLHRLDRLTSGLLLFGRSPKKAREMEHQIRNRQVQKEYICRVEGDFPEGIIECNKRIEVVSYKIGVCKVSPKGKDCTTSFQRISYNGKTSVVLCKPLTGRMHQIRVHLQYLGFPIINDPLYNHEVFGLLKGRGGDMGGKTDEELVRDLITIHNAENWLGVDGDSDISMFKTVKGEFDVDALSLNSETKHPVLNDQDLEITSGDISQTCANSPHAADSTESYQKNDNKIAQVKNTNSTDIISFSTSNTNKSDAQCEKIDSYSHLKVTVSTQTGHEAPDMIFNAKKMTTDKHCYECKVRYRDPKPNDLVMYLHAWKYKGPGWEYETVLPNWGSADWIELD